MRRGQAVRAGGFAALALLAGCSKEAPPKPAVVEAVVPVRSAVVAPSSGAGRLAVSGTVRRQRETALAFNTGGRIAAIDVREGDSVSKGQVLARLDPTGLAAAQASARAEAERADADLRRLQSLFDKGWVTAQRLDTARATAAAAKARVEQTGFDVGLAVIRAPSAGTVLARPAEPGQIVNPGATILLIGEAESGYVLRVPLADAELAKVRLGQPAAVVIPAIGATPLAGRVSELGARGDDGAGTFRVEIALPERPDLRSGMIGKAMLRIGDPGATTATGASVVVPATAVFSARADEGFVYLLDTASNRVKRRLVALGGIDDDGVTITAGLSAGDVVITSGPDRLRDGARVIDKGPPPLPAATPARG